MKLKDYEDLEQYSLKNFDLKAYQLAQTQPDPEPIPAACDSPNQQFPKPDEPHFSLAPNPVQAEPSQPAPEPWDVHFGPHFNLQTVSYQPLSPAESWKMPRWLVATVGLFFGSAAVLTLVVCVALLRDPKPAATAQLAVPAAPVATTSAAPAPPAAVTKAPGAAAVRHSAPAANPLHDDSALGRRSVVSRHPAVVHRQSYGSRRVAARSTSSSAAPQETETPSRPPKDALDQLLGESSL